MTSRKPFLDRLAPGVGTAGTVLAAVVTAVVVTLLAPPVPLAAAPGDLAASAELAAAPGTPDPHGVWRERLTADPCDLGRLISLQPACTTPEECTAWRLWQRHMPQGPMAAIPTPRVLAPVMPAGAVETEPTAPSAPGPPTLVLKLEREGDPDAQVLAEKLGDRLRARGLRPGDTVDILAVPYDKGRTRRYTLRVPEEGLAPNLLIEPRLEPEIEPGPGWMRLTPCPAGH
jgi:hypothetical protein